MVLLLLFRLPFVAACLADTGLVFADRAGLVLDAALAVFAIFGFATALAGAVLLRAVVLAGAFFRALALGPVLAATVLRLAAVFVTAFPRLGAALTAALFAATGLAFVVVLVLALAATALRFAVAFGFALGAPARAGAVRARVRLLAAAFVLLMRPTFRVPKRL